MNSSSKLYYIKKHIIMVVVMQCGSHIKDIQMITIFPYIIKYSVISVLLEIIVTKMSWNHILVEDGISKYVKYFFLITKQHTFLLISVTLSNKLTDLKPKNQNLHFFFLLILWQMSAYMSLIEYNIINIFFPLNKSISSSNSNILFKYIMEIKP